MPGIARLRPMRRQDGSILFGRKRWKTLRPDEQSRSMKSSATSKFWRAYHSLPLEIQAEAEKLIAYGKKTHDTLRCALSAKDRTGRCGSRAAGARSDACTRTRSTGFGSAITTHT